jgi:Na+-translocating ferredoxin:NAD+ oxidoreductase RnfC subunit
LVGHPYPGHLKPHQKTLVADMTKNDVNPSNILLALKERDPENLSTIKTIYNERYSYRKSVRYPRTEMQHLMKLLESNSYTYFHRTDEESKMVKDIF